MISFPCVESENGVITLVIPLKMKLSNTFLVSVCSISKKSLNPNGVCETMKHMMATTCQRIKAMYVKDLFKSLVYHKVGTTEVHHLCEKLCQKMTSKKTENLVNEVMRWKYNDAQRVYKKTVYEEKKLWRTYRLGLINENIINDYNKTWGTEKGKVLKEYRTKRKKKIKWLVGKYKHNDNVPDYMNGIRIKDIVIDDDYCKGINTYGGVTLTDCEKSALHLHPKFSVYDKIDPIDCEAEVEKTLATIRLKKMNVEKRKSEYFEIQKQQLDFSKMRSTDIPFRNRTSIPKSLDVDQELSLQNLKRELVSVTKDYQLSVRSKIHNITKDQQEGIQSLITRRKAKEIVIFQTDKSGAMSVDTPNNYCKAAETHIKADEIIDKQQYKDIEKQFNAHSTFWCNMLRCGQKYNNEVRIRTSMFSHNSASPSLYFYRKDHKDPITPIAEAIPTQQTIDVEHPVRPLCDVSDSYSHRFSYLMCLVLREIIYESDTVCGSSEDLIAEINDVNTKNCIGKDTVIGSMDVKSMYPSLDVEVVIEVVGEEFAKSKLQICNVDLEEVGLYLALNKGTKFLNDYGLSEVCPKRKSNRRKPLMTGSGSLQKKEERHGPWLKRKRNPIAREKIIMIKEAIKIGLSLILNNHVYQFNNTLRKQSQGAPIGLDLTEVVAKIFMNWWDRQFLLKLQQLKYEVHLYKRYVDDINLCVEGIKEDDVNGIEYLGEKAQDDMELDERTFSVLNKIANEITECIKIETDYPSKNEDKKVPILDVKVYITKLNRDNNTNNDGPFRILYEHYVKPMASKYVIGYYSALSLEKKRVILTQQCLKIILNCSKDLPWDVAKQHMTEFVKRMQFSGYNKRFRFEIVNSAFNAYHAIEVQVRAGKRPMYRKINWKREERKQMKADKKTNWYEKDGCDAVIFVPATPKSELARMYKEKIKKSDIKIKVVERGGTKIKNLLQINDPLSDKKCSKEDKCFVCESGNDKSLCRSSSINYKIECTDVLCKGIYNGQSSKNGYSRGQEHCDDFKRKGENSVMWKHCREKHGGQISKFKMSVRKTNRNDPTKRQITEAIYINKTNPEVCMNDKTEWNYINLPMLKK